ncbi:RluA family pseudouridine synthase [Neisseria weaveri]|uniref:RluA family pseudouridine synthase n=1 Tax=Neisseria weaveri TaxID=28091 RepID=UPI000D30C353|nr:RluA family pseudouridine synthase [Neisseria weaveri]
MATISKDLVNHIRISENEAGQRLDNYLIKILKGVPKSHIQRIIRAGEVRVNKKRCKADSRIEAGDEVRIPPIRIAEKERPSEKQAAPAREFEIVYEDDAMLVINKPSGTAVHGGSGVSFGVIEQVRRARPQAKYLELVHRLDKDTSGLLMIAKKRSALVKLHEAIRNDHPKKIYLAVGVGKLDSNKINVRLPLLKYTGAQGEKMVRVSEDGQSAHTIFRVINRFSEGLLHQVGLSHLTFVEATLKTGRTHQIRVHMQSQNCPIAGDERYGDYQANKHLQKLGLKRMFLHAAELHLNHPLSNEPLVLKAPLPQELQQFIVILEHQNTATAARPSEKERP